MVGSDDSLGDFEDPEQPQSSQDTDPKWSPRFYGGPDHLKNTPNNHLLDQWTSFLFQTLNLVKVWHQSGTLFYMPHSETQCTVTEFPATVYEATHPKVKTIEWRVEVVLGSQAIHLHEHLCQEQAQEYKLSQVCPSRGRKHTKVSVALVHHHCHPPMLECVRHVCPCVFAVSLSVTKPKTTQQCFYLIKKKRKGNRCHMISLNGKGHISVIWGTFQWAGFFFYEVGLYPVV